MFFILFSSKLQISSTIFLKLKDHHEQTKRLVKKKSSVIALRFDIIIGLLN